MSWEPYCLSARIFAACSECIGLKGKRSLAKKIKRSCNFVIPHLTQAIRLSNRLNALSFQQNAALEGLVNANIGIIVVDAAAKILFCNGIGEQALASKMGLSVRSGRLYTEEVTRNPVLLKLIKDAALAGVGRCIHAGGHMTLPNRHGAPSTILISPLRPEHAESERHHPKAVIFITNPNQKRAINPSLLNQHYGLTPAEARLTAALVEGERLQDYAERVEISLHTAKTQLKTIFSKTGTSRQSDLIRAILNNPLLCHS